MSMSVNKICNEKSLAEREVQKRSQLESQQENLMFSKSLSVKITTKYHVALGMHEIYSEYTYSRSPLKTFLQKLCKKKLEDFRFFFSEHNEFTPEQDINPKRNNAPLSTRPVVSMTIGRKCIF